MAITKLNTHIEPGSPAKSSQMNSVIDKVDEIIDTVNNSGDVSTKQDKLYSGVNIKTVNGQSILGSGNINIASHAFLEEDEMEALTADIAIEGIIYFGLEPLETTSATFSENKVTCPASFASNKVSVTGVTLTNNKITV